MLFLKYIFHGRKAYRYLRVGLFVKQFSTTSRQGLVNMNDNISTLSFNMLVNAIQQNWLYQSTIRTYTTEPYKGYRYHGYINPV